MVMQFLNVCLLKKIHSNHDSNFLYIIAYQVGDRWERESINTQIKEKLSSKYYSSRDCCS